MFTIFLIAISLSLDSFATSVILSIKNKKNHLETALKVSLVFATFQTLLPFIGYKIGDSIAYIILPIYHWIAVILLSGVGIKFIVESFDEKKDLEKINDLNLKIICLLGLATSIDAFAVGITFAFMELYIFYILLIIFCITFCITFLGFYIGKNFSLISSKKVEIFGGIVLIAIGLKILLSHLIA